MKIAVCISGQPRSAEEAYPLIYKNIILPNQADVFIHMNYSKNDSYIERSHADNPYKSSQFPPNIDEKVIQLYQPVSYLIEEPKPFSKPGFRFPPSRIARSMSMNAHNGWTEEEHCKHMVKQITSMYYSIFKCNELKETYALTNNITYDYVIRIRFDIKPNLPLCCINYDPSFIYYQEMSQPDELISDWINFGSNTVMNVYSSMYFMVDYLNTFKYYNKTDRLENTYEPSETIPGCYEYFIRDLMTLCNIPKRAFSIHCELW
jgi:hypothetical protein